MMVLLLLVKGYANIISSPALVSGSEQTMSTKVTPTQSSPPTTVILEEETMAIQKL